MTKRIVSGVFLLVALGALGLIISGALTSGEQLIVRFLTAIIVAALALYVVSDLRLQSADEAADRSTKGNGRASRSTTTTSGTRRTGSGELHPNSTAAFMATVTGKRSGTTTPTGDDAKPATSAPDSESPEEPEPVAIPAALSEPSPYTEEEEVAAQWPPAPTQWAPPTGSAKDEPTDETTETAETSSDDTATSAAIEPMAGLEAAAYAQERAIDRRSKRDAPADIEEAIQAGELDVISSLIDDGSLSTSGPLSDRDIRTMVYVAFTSSELRKILLAGGVVDGDTRDLGPVEVFSTIEAASDGGLPSLAAAATPAGAPASTDDDAEDEPDEARLDEPIAASF